MFTFFKKNYKDLRLRKSEYSFKHGVYMLLSHIDIKCLSTIAECYNLDSKLLSRNVIFDKNYITKNTVYFGLVDSQNLNFLTHEDIDILFRFDIIELFFSDSFNGMINERFSSFVEGKNLEYFSSLYIRIDTQHEYIYLKWNDRISLDQDKLLESIAGTLQR